MDGINLASDTIDNEDLQALSEWLLTNPQLTKGDLTLELEERWAEKIGTKYSVFVNSGSSAILLTLSAIQQLRNKQLKIVVPALSWSTDLSSPMLLGMDVVLCDCNLQDLSCDLNALENIFKEYNPDLFLLVSPLGLVPDMDRIIDLCNKYEVELLEDVCESMGSEYNQKALGSFGLASFFSMYYGHHISTIEGGFINTNSEELYHYLLMMRSHGWDRDLPKWKQDQLRTKYSVSEFDSLYTFYVPSYNLRSTDLQAFLGLRAIKKIDIYSFTRALGFKTYQDNVKNNELNLIKRGFVSSFAYPVVNKNRDQIIKMLRIKNIEVRPLIAGNMANKPMWKDHNFKGSFPNAELIDEHGFYVPNHHNLKLREIKLIAKIINDNC